MDKLVNYSGTIDELSRAPQQHKHVPLVVIAASAGGLDPITEILDFYPDNLPVATVVIQHLSPSYRSELVNLLQTHTHQPVHELRDTTDIAAGNIYVIQPGTQIVLQNDQIYVHTRDLFERPYFAIDVFLESVARRGAPLNACVVLLSGTGSDGTLGCRAVRQEGGFILVQQLSDAKFDGMPLSVVNAGAYDEVQPARQIPARIEAWLEHGQRPPLPENNLLNDPITLLYGEGSQGPHVRDLGLNPYAPVFDLLRQSFDLDLTAYKIGTIDRRITQRMRRLGFSTVSQYVKLLAQGGAELRALFSDLMIGVTSFFRNPQVFELLESKVLPDLLERSTEPIKIWVCGCSTGEEAYSIAMLLQKLIDQRGSDQEYRIFATDINPDAIRRAAEGGFEYSTLQPFINRFGLHELVSDNHEFGRLRINPDIRKNIVFSVQNVLKHSPLHGLDMVMCRNMLIYFTSEAQRKVMSNFHFGLKEGGTLVLGESEGPSGLDPYFEDVDARLKVFAKRAGIPLSSVDRWQLNRSVAPLTALRPNIVAPEPLTTSVARSAFEAAFSAVAGNSLIVRSDGEVQYVTGYASELFGPISPGRPGLSLHNHISNIELQALLQYGVSEAIESGQTIEWDYPYDGEGGHLQFGVLRFSSLPALLERHPSVLVQMLRADGADQTVSSCSQTPLSSLLASEGGLERLAVLERQNAELRQIVSESVQDKETFHEELQSANEELLSSNEELQSTNEELQSVNEELHSVNAELSEKIRQLTEASNDINNLLSATNVALLFLDEQLRIRRFTEPARQHFPLGMQDLGRPLIDLATNLKDLEIGQIGQAVILSGQPQEHQVRTNDGTWLQVVFTPYREPDNTVTGVVMSIYDITPMRHRLNAEMQARVQRELSQQLLNIYYWDCPNSAHSTLSIAPNFYTLLGLEENAKTLTWEKLFTYIHPEDLEALKNGLSKALATRGMFSAEIRLQHTDGRYLWQLFTAASYTHSEGHLAMLGMFVDINERKRKEITAKQQQTAALHENRIFNIGMLVSGVAHELNNPLAALQLGMEQIARAHHKQNLSAEQIEKIIHAQQDALKRMNYIISNLLQFARKDNAAPVKTAHIERLLQDSLLLIEPRALEAGVRIQVNGASAHLVLQCHPLEIAQALVNILSNAVHAASLLSERWVEVNVRETPEHIIIAIKDSGLTRDIPHKEKLFTPFYTTKEVGRGTGLGLILSQGIVESHGGTLVLDASAENTTFVLTLPKQYLVIEQPELAESNS